MGPRVSHRSGLGLTADGSCKATAGAALFPAGKEKRMKQAHRDEEAGNLHKSWQTTASSTGAATWTAPGWGDTGVTSFAGISVLVLEPPVLYYLLLETKKLHLSLNLFASFLKLVLVDFFFFCSQGPCSKHIKIPLGLSCEQIRKAATWLAEVLNTCKIQVGGFPRT